MGIKDTTINLLKPGTILVVEDDAVFRAELKELLTDEGYDVVAISSANHAISYCQSQPWTWHPWMLITDLVMDGMGGYQLMRRIGEIYPTKTIPMIVISRLGSTEDIIEAEVAGASAYLKKPIEPTKLFDAITAVTTKKKSRIEITTSSKLI